MRRFVPYIRTCVLYLIAVTGTIGLFAYMQAQASIDELFGMVAAGLVFIISFACFAAAVVLLVIHLMLGRFDPEAASGPQPIDIPAPRLHSVRAIALACALGLVPGACVLLAVNYARAGLRRQVVAVLLVAAAYFFGIWSPAWFCFHYAQSGLGLAYLAHIVGVAALAFLLQGDLIARQRREGAVLESEWIAVLIGVPIGAAQLAIFWSRSLIAAF